MTQGCRQALMPGGNGSVALRSATTDIVAGEVRAKVSFTIVNPGPSELRYWPCRVVVQEGAGGEWRFVWGRLCTQDGAVTVLPQQALVDTMVVRVRGESGSSSWTYDRTDGLYRLSVHLEDARGVTLPMTARITEPFVLTETLK
jgi:hypothetical protein